MTERRRVRFRLLLRVACVAALVALALMSWSLFDPTVWPVMVAMSVGQVLGTLSLGLFLYVVVADWRRVDEPIPTSMPRPPVEPEATKQE